MNEISPKNTNEYRIVFHFLKFYFGVFQEQGLWGEALRVCKEYLPVNFNVLQAEYHRDVGSKVSRDVNSLIVQARQWEQNGEFQTAVDCYVKVNGKNLLYCHL